MTRLRSSQGITIIETTVMLSVLFILAGVLSPIVSESVMTARAVKAKNDAAMLATGIVNLQKDLGADAFSYGTTAGRPVAGLSAASATGAARMPDVMSSEGDDPQVEDTQSAMRGSTRGGLFVAPGGLAKASQKALSEWLDLTREAIDDHLMTNKRGYRLRQPGEYGGWNGPYLSAKLSGDPWGNRYMINTSWLGGGASAADASGNLRRAVYVVSAGANGVIETPFEQPITEAHAYGDDIVIRIQ